MKTWLAAYLVTGLALLAADLVWLSTMTGIFYRPALGELLLDQPDLAAAALFYLVYVLGIVFFAVAPALQSGRWTTALVNGAALGLLAYATYDLTNQATLKGWPAVVTVVDIAWGIVLTAGAAVAGYLGANAITPAAARRPE